MALPRPRIEDSESKAESSGHLLDLFGVLTTFGLERARVDFRRLAGR